MAQRINALVHVGMDADEVAEVIGCPVASVVNHGNGYAIIDPSKCPPAKKAAAPRAKAKVATPEVEMDPALDS
jgi:hypothetical protein